MGVEGVHFDEGTSDLISFKSLRLSQYVVNDLGIHTYNVNTTTTTTYKYILLPW